MHSLSVCQFVLKGGNKFLFILFFTVFAAFSHLNVIALFDLIFFRMKNLKVTVKKKKKNFFI